ncbi:MAG: DUF192 domain-containing protein [Pseudomonadota bacterium]
MIRTSLSAFALSLILAAAACAQSAEPGPNDSVLDPTAPDAIVVYGGPEALGVEKADGELVLFQVEIADDPVNRQRGMMFRESLDEGAGMLFDFGEVRPVSIWMRNTLIPLDILYVRQNGLIGKIIANAQPMSERQLWSDYPVLGVIELNAGAAAAAGIQPGDQVLHPVFGTNLPEPGEAASDEQAASEPVSQEAELPPAEAEGEEG